MATNQDRMNTDYIWIREHSTADSWAQARTHGYNYLYYNIPNKHERYEMIYRSLGKQYDWELEKFRLQKKHPDRGNKRRFIKNVLRFIKNPAGYAWWKTYKIRRGKGRYIAMAMTFGLIFMLFKYKRQSYNIAKKNHFVALSGQNLEGSGQTRLGYHDQSYARLATPMNSFLYHEIPGWKLVVNPTNYQHYRKYFEIRKKYGVGRPSS